MLGGKEGEKKITEPEKKSWMGRLVILLQTAAYYLLRTAARGTRYYSVRGTCNVHRFPSGTQ